MEQAESGYERMDTYKEYEQACERIRQQNEHLLSEFEDWLAARRLSDKRINSHTRHSPCVEAAV